MSAHDTITANIEKRIARMTKRGRNKISTYDLSCIALFTAIITVCSWIALPTAIPFTLQTLGIVLSVGMMGGKRGTMAVLTYVMLGTVGVPVFSGFTGGIGVVTGITGGYIVGFIFTALVMWAAENIPGYATKRNIILPASMAAGMIVCYAFGTVWFMLVYTKTQAAVTLGTVLSMCVAPFIIPDIIKISLAAFLSKRLRNIVR